MVLRNPRLWRNQRNTPEGLKLDPHLKWGVANLHYIGVESVKIAKERVAIRVKRGGHGISEKDIERRYIDTFCNLKFVLPDCNLAAFYDNTKEFGRFAIYKNGKLVRVSHEIPLWYEKFIENVK